MPVTESESRLGCHSPVLGARAAYLFVNGEGFGIVGVFTKGIVGVFTNCKPSSTLCARIVSLWYVQVDSRVERDVTGSHERPNSLLALDSTGTSSQSLPQTVHNA